MRVSLGLYPDVAAGDVVRTGVLAETLGYHGVWLADSHLLWREPHTILGALAAWTQTIRLATAVTNPLTRHPTVTASAFCTLAELSDGRAVVGISIGDSSLRTMGLKPATIDRLARTVTELRDLLQGRRIDFPDDRSAQITFAGGFDIPLYIAATGPRMLRLAGQIADGVILMNGVAPDLIQAASELVAAGAVETGRDPGAVQRVVWAACHASDDCSEESIAAVKYNVARAILRDIPGLVDATTRAIAARVRERYDYAQHGAADADFAALIPDDLVPRFAFAGTPQAVATQLDALRDIGVEEVALAIPAAPDHAARDTVLRLLAPRKSKSPLHSMGLY